jgi:hypothetical protein
MKFDVYGRFQLEVLRENNAWIVYALVLARVPATAASSLPNPSRQRKSPATSTTYFVDVQGNE